MRPWRSRDPVAVIQRQTRNIESAHIKRWKRDGVSSAKTRKLGWAGHVAGMEIFTEMRSLWRNRLRWEQSLQGSGLDSSGSKSGPVDALGPTEGRRTPLHWTGQYLRELDHHQVQKMAKGFCDFQKKLKEKTSGEVDCWTLHCTVNALAKEIKVSPKEL